MGGLGCSDLRQLYFSMETLRQDLMYVKFCLLSSYLRWVVRHTDKRRYRSSSRSFCIPENCTNGILEMLSAVLWVGSFS